MSDITRPKLGTLIMKQLTKDEPGSLGERMASWKSLSAEDREALIDNAIAHPDQIGLTVEEVAHLA
jgi:hypothetical protein